MIDRPLLFDPPAVAESRALEQRLASIPRAVTFFVPGVPQPGGSKNGFPVRMKSGRTRVNIVDDAKRNAPWRAVVALAARYHFETPLAGPLVVSFVFAMPRPKSHFGTGRNASTLKASAPSMHTGKPDALKLARSTEDALTGIAWLDDCQTVDLRIRKVYAERPGCWVTITEFREPTKS